MFLRNNILRKERVLFLAKNKPFADIASLLINRHFERPIIKFGEVGQKFPIEFEEEKFDYIISYISPWIVPNNILKKVSKASINFHPGPPNYPGIGCTNFAIYNEESTFGITVHHMEERVDSGKIIMVKTFPILPNDTVYTLTNRCYAFIFIAFCEILDMILKDKPLPESELVWKRKPYTRKELNELCKITIDMSQDEVVKRVYSTSYPGQPGAYLDFYGLKFIFSEKIDDGD